MSDLFSKVSELLSDPKAAGAIRQIAASVSSPEGGESDTESALPPPAPESSPLGDLPFSLGAHRREVDLLNAMRPYLRASRADKVDRALKAIRMIDLLSNFR